MSLLPIHIVMKVGWSPIACSRAVCSTVTQDEVVHHVVLVAGEEVVDVAGGEEHVVEVGARDREVVVGRRKLCVQWAARGPGDRQNDRARSHLEQLEQVGDAGRRDQRQLEAAVDAGLPREQSRVGAGLVVLGEAVRGEACGQAVPEGDVAAEVDGARRHRREQRRQAQDEKSLLHGCPPYHLRVSDAPNRLAVVS